MPIPDWLRTLAARLNGTRVRRLPQRPAFRPRLEALEDRVTPSTGGLLDPTFGSGGHVLSSFSNHYDAANAVTVQPDSKIVIAGTSAVSGSKTGNDFLVARYNADGSVDSSFGSGGHAATDFNALNDRAEAVALQPQTDGTNKILVAGLATTTKKGAAYDLFGLARYNANGTLDTTFGSKGKVTTDLGNTSWAFAMAVDGSGRTVVAGYTGGNVAALVRYTASGALDTTFGSGGKLVTGIHLANQTRLDSIALQTDGKIVLAGTTIDPATSTPEFVVARFNSNGTTDTGFGSGGLVTTLVGGGEHFGGVALQGNGKIVVSGSESTGFDPFALYLLRYNADGTPDMGFGTGGVEAVPSPGKSGDGGIDAHGSGVAVQADGKIVAGGQFYDTTAQQWNLAALRVNSNGTVDSGYGSGGWATVQFASNDTVEAIALQPDGRLLLAGYAKPTSTGPTEVALVRFLSSAPQIGSFTANPNPATSGSSVTLTASNLTDGNPNSTIAQVTFYYFDSNNNQVTLGAGTQTNGVWTLTSMNAFGLTAGSYTLYAQAEDSYGVFGDLFASTFQVS